MDRKFCLGLLLFCMLGWALSAIGIKASENPVSFFTIILLAILIDLNASIK